MQILRTAELILGFQRRAQRCYMKQKTMARTLGFGTRRPDDPAAECGDRTIRRHVAVLKNLGLLEVIDGQLVNIGDGTFHRSPNVYLLRFSEKTHASRGAKPQVAPSGHKRPQQLPSFLRKLESELLPCAGETDAPGDNDLGEPWRDEGFPDAMSWALSQIKPRPAQWKRFTW